jgi:hypothetical protein
MHGGLWIDFLSFSSFFAFSYGFFQATNSNEMSDTVFMRGLP